MRIEGGVCGAQEAEVGSAGQGPLIVGEVLEPLSPATPATEQ